MRLIVRVLHEQNQHRAFSYFFTRYYVHNSYLVICSGRGETWSLIFRVFVVCKHEIKVSKYHTMKLTITVCFLAVSFASASSYIDCSNTGGDGKLDRLCNAWKDESGNGGILHIGPQSLSTNSLCFVVLLSTVLV
mmetsp:Transcript_30608/g.49051  ORF Transcript_30608/g.49051 Transcript_30608/m.49051 type:complete len:135 (+) Transcript_30608:337-741(+)